MKLSHCARFIFLLAATFSLTPAILFAAPTQEEVLRSINQSVGKPVDAERLLAVVFALAALLILLALMTHRRNRSTTPKIINHPGKLLKEMARRVALKPAEVRQLKILADGMELTSPLVLALCPSLLEQALKEKVDRVDRKTVAGMVKKFSENKPGVSGHAPVVKS